jgi:3-oxoacyl-[acyl-carrier protein] reductase
MTLALHQKVALVTGASRGIGAAIAARLARDGAEVIVHYGSGAQVVAGIEKQGGRARAVRADLSTKQGPTQLAEAVSAKRIDVLVNNAGVAPFASIDEMDEASYDDLSAINMRSLFFVTQKFLPRVPSGGRIINLSSVVAPTAFAGIPAYAATKGFVDTLTIQLASPHGITFRRSGCHRHQNE